MFRTSIALFSLLTACAAHEAPVTSPTVAAVVAASPTASPAGAPLTGADLVGRWASTTCEAYDNGSGGKSYLTRSFTLTADRWSLDLAVYGDAGCTYGLFTAAIEGPYTLGGAATVPGATRGDFAFATNRWTALTPDMAGVFTQAGCGAGAWQVGVAQDVSATGCIGVARPVASCPAEHDVVAVSGDALSFGARVTDLCVEAGRPTALAPYPVVRK